ncbi:hypothetical protein EGW08_002001 [Elysia chlorotica]|uniref:acireductone dioxygenase (Fe(2+)-requiring) n=1 Tax=Elysia chlorotica TaxID=188477 RepID=A0A3S1BS52_ELYCH|nr:hypothetical protein EGW08_002001 [Elysia chlorotica]
MKIFNSEHLHPDEEIRFVSAGSGYFDIRSREDTWVRLEVTEGDFMVIPTGTYHRFYLDTQGYVKLRRFFTEAPSWIAFPRPEGDMYTAKHRDVVQDRAVLVEAN